MAKAKDFPKETHLGSQMETGTVTLKDFRSVTLKGSRSVILTDSQKLRDLTTVIPKGTH